MSVPAIGADAVGTTLREFDSYVRQLQSADYQTWTGILRTLIQFCRTDPTIRQVLGPLPRTTGHAEAWLQQRRTESGAQPGRAPLVLPPDPVTRLEMLEELFTLVANGEVETSMFMRDVVGAMSDTDVQARDVSQKLITPFAEDVRNRLALLKSNATNPPVRRWGEWVAMEKTAFKTTGMSAIWKVRDAGDPDGVVRVLKELRYNKGRGSAAYRRFEREINTLTDRLKDVDGIVDVLDHCVPDDGSGDRPYFVMPLAETSFERAAKTYKGQLEVVLTKLLPVIDALGRAHQVGVYHRDLKPSNVLLFGDAHEPRVADFGIAFLVDEERVTRAEADTIGTEDYVAPELRGGGTADNITPAADIYSLGKTLYAIVSGSGARTLPREWLSDERFDLVKLLNDTRLEHHTGLLERMIAEEPRDRYQTMMECRGQFERAIANLRAGVPYEQGMYGGAHSPIERYSRLSSTLEKPESVTRTDAVRGTIDEALQRTSTRAAAYESREAAGFRMVLGQIHVGAANEAAACAEDLMSVGLPLVRYDNLDGLEEWLGMVTEPLINDGYEYRVSRLVLRPSAVLAVHGAASLAWQLRRFKLLRRLVDANVDGSRTWNHHPILGRESARLFGWLSESLKQSSVLRRADAVLADDPAVAASVFSGLTILKFLSTPEYAEDVTRLRDDPDAQYGGPAYVGYYWPAAKWAQTLLDACTRKPPLERELAREVFGISVEEFRATCARITPALAKAISKLNWDISRMIEWRMVVDPRSWDDWCGRQRAES